MNPQFTNHNDQNISSPPIGFLYFSGMCLEFEFWNFLKKGNQFQTEIQIDHLHIRYH